MQTYGTAQRTDLILIIKANEMRCFSNLFWQRTLQVRTADLSETRRVLHENKFEKQRISLALIIRTYHDAQSVRARAKFWFISMEYIFKLFTA